MTAKIKLVAQVFGFLCMGLLALYGGLALIGGPPAWASGHAGAAALAGSAPQAAPSDAPSLVWSGASVPLLMNYQGYLRDAEGDPLSGSYTMTLRIYAGVADPVANRLWEEKHENVTVRDGQFSVLLGNTTALMSTLFASPDRFVGVMVHPYDEMVPRQRLASIPYALQSEHSVLADEATHAGQATNASQASNADLLDGQHAGSFASVGHSHSSLGNLTLSGDLRVDGNVWQSGPSSIGDSNTNYGGGWSTYLQCSNGQYICGILTREQSGYGLINLRAYCCPL